MVQSLTHLVASMESPLVFFSDSQPAVASVNKKRNAKQKAVQETHMDQIVEVPCEQIFRHNFEFLRNHWKHRTAKELKLLKHCESLWQSAQQKLPA